VVICSAILLLVCITVDLLNMAFLPVQYMIGALAEIASGRRLFVDTYDRKTKETKVGILQVAPEVAQWLGR
jgi:hypothetical protein